MGQNMQKLFYITTVTLLLSASCQAAQEHPEIKTEFETINAEGYKGVTKVTSAQLKLYQKLHKFDPESKTTHSSLKKRCQKKAHSDSYQDPEEQQKKEERCARRAALLSPSCTNLEKKQEEEIQQKMNNLTTPDRPASPKNTWIQIPQEKEEITEKFWVDTSVARQEILTPGQFQAQEEGYPLAIIALHITEKDAFKTPVAPPPYIK